MVRARKLEGMLVEKEATIGGLQHQLCQADVQRRLVADVQAHASLMHHLRLDAKCGFEAGEFVLLPILLRE